MYYYPDELYHHGIKGQRWGVRNGPPYPLNPQTHASVVRSGSGRGKSKNGRKIKGYGDYHEERRWDPYRKKMYSVYVNDAGNKKGSLVDKLDQRGWKRHDKKNKIGGYDEDKSARRKRIARNVAIGAGLGAATLGTAYAIKKGRRSSLATSKATSLGDKANKLFGRASSLEGSGKGGALANRLTNQATRASGQARRYTNIASGYAKRRNIGIAAGALGLGAAGLGAGSYIRDRRRRRKIGRR